MLKDSTERLQLLPKPRLLNNKKKYLQNRPLIRKKLKKMQIERMEEQNTRP